MTNTQPLLAALMVTAVFSVSGMAHAQEQPRLPELQFAEILEGSQDKYTGDRWSYMEDGSIDAPPIVFLHGVGANSMHWRHQYNGLSNDFRVIGWNAPGYMLTDGFKSERPSCEDYADSLKDFLDSLELSQINIVGNSFGSRVAQCFGMYYPEQVIKMAFTGTGRGGNVSEEDASEAIAKRRAQVSSGGYGFGERVSALLGPNATPEMVKDVQHVLRATNPEGFLHGVGLGLDSSYQPEVSGPKLTFPVLLIHGDKDGVNVLEGAQAVLEYLPDGRLEVLEGIGHLPEVEDPKRVNDLLRAHFN